MFFEVKYIYFNIDPFNILNTNIQNHVILDTKFLRICWVKFDFFSVFHWLKLLLGKVVINILYYLSFLESYFNIDFSQIVLLNKSIQLFNHGLSFMIILEQ